MIFCHVVCPPYSSTNVDPLWFSGSNHKVCLWASLSLVAAINFFRTAHLLKNKAAAWYWQSHFSSLSFRGNNNKKVNLTEVGSGGETQNAHGPLPNEVILVLRLPLLHSPSLCLSAPDYHGRCLWVVQPKYDFELSDVETLDPPAISSPLVLSWCSQNALQTAVLLYLWLLSTGNWVWAHSNLTVITYLQVKTACTVNWDISSTLYESGADDKRGYLMGSRYCGTNTILGKPLRQKEAEMLLYGHEQELEYINDTVEWEGKVYSLKIAPRHQTSAYITNRMKSF